MEAWSWSGFVGAGRRGVQTRSSFPPESLVRGCCGKGWAMQGPSSCSLRLPRHGLGHTNLGKGRHYWVCGRDGGGVVDACVVGELHEGLDIRGVPPERRSLIPLSQNYSTKRNQTKPNQTKSLLPYQHLHCTTSSLSLRHNNTQYSIRTIKLRSSVPIIGASRIVSYHYSPSQPLPCPTQWHHQLPPSQLSHPKPDPAANRASQKVHLSRAPNSRNRHLTMTSSSQSSRKWTNTRSANNAASPTPRPNPSHSPVAAGGVPGRRMAGEVPCRANS